MIDDPRDMGERDGNNRDEMQRDLDLWGWVCVVVLAVIVAVLLAVVIFVPKAVG